MFSFYSEVALKKSEDFALAKTLKRTYHITLEKLHLIFCPKNARIE